MKATKLLLPLLLLFFSSDYSQGSTVIPGGNVSGHWVLTNSPFEIYGNITIPADSVLEIDSGVVVQFQGHYQLKVNGSLLALGTATNTIAFTAVNDWWGIRFDGIASTQDSSLFINCVIEKGNANGSGNYAYGGGFFISGFSKIRIESCVIKNNYSYLDGGAIYCLQASPLIYGNSIFSNITNGSGYAAIHCESGASPFIVGNQIYSNSLMAIYCGNSNPRIISNSITNHLALGIDLSYSNPKIINNVITGGGMGIYCEHSSPAIKGNLIANHSTYYGAGVRCRFSSSPYFVNNTICNNTASEFGGGVYADQSSSPIFKNTILWGNVALNGGDQVALDQTANPSFLYCDLQGGTGDIYYFDAPNSFTGTFSNSFSLDPLFTNATAGDFTLQPASPCINTGTLDTLNLSLLTVDLANAPRVCNNRIDMGAYEMCSTGISESHELEIPLSAYPNPASDYIVFEIADPELFTCSVLVISNILGTTLNVITVNSYATIFPVNSLASGVYFYQLQSENRTLASGRFLVE